MGASKNKRQKFLIDHPYCCFCGGQDLATTIDHIPARICFPGRNGPDGFEFPACAVCQSASRQDELAFGYFVRLIDPSNVNYRSEEIRKAVTGIKNNLPHLLPKFDLSAREKRKALVAMGHDKPINLATSDIPSVAIPAEIDLHVHRYARKLAAALYYREKEKPISPQSIMWTRWCLATDKRQMDRFLQVAEMMPLKTIGARPNLNFGNRFGYRFDKGNDNDLFSAMAQFGQGLVVAMLVVDAESAKALDEDDGWVPASAVFR